MAMIIEMVGAPGAGKTTLLAAIEDGCRAVGLTPVTVAAAARPFAARSILGRFARLAVPARLEPRALWGVFRIETGWHTLRAMIERPALTRHVLSSQRRRPSAADARGRRVVYWYLRTMGSRRFLLARAQEGEVIVLDEGFVHRAVQLHASVVESPTTDQIAAYVAALPRPDLLVHVDASPDVCERRVHDRGVWARLDHRTPAEIRRFVHHAHETVALVRGELDRRGWAVIDVDNGAADPAAVIATLAREVAERLAACRGGSVGPSA
jgi:thymidylate kinase